MTLYDKTTNSDTAVETDKISMKSKGKDHYLCGLFDTRENADKAYQEALNRGYKVDDINIIMSDATQKKIFPDGGVKTGTRTAKGLGVGSAVGATIGGILGALTAAGTTVALPGLSLIVVGPLVAGLVGAGTGGMTGGLLGSLIGLGIPEAKARIYEEGIKKGHIFISIKYRTDKDRELENSWDKYSIHR